MVVRHTPNRRSPFWIIKLIIYFSYLSLFIYVIFYTSHDNSCHCSRMHESNLPNHSNEGNTYVDAINLIKFSNFWQVFKFYSFSKLLLHIFCSLALKNFLQQLNFALPATFSCFSDKTYNFDSFQHKSIAKSENSASQDINRNLVWRALQACCKCTTGIMVVSGAF